MDSCGEWDGGGKIGWGGLWMKGEVLDGFVGLKEMRTGIVRCSIENCEALWIGLKGA